VLLPHAKALCDDDGYDIDSDRIKSTVNPMTAADRAIYVVCLIFPSETKGVQHFVLSYWLV